MIRECDPTAAPWVTAQLTEARQAGDYARQAAGIWRLAFPYARERRAWLRAYPIRIRLPAPWPPAPPLRPADARYGVCPACGAPYHFAPLATGFAYCTECQTAGESAPP